MEGEVLNIALGKHPTEGEPMQRIQLIHFIEPHPLLRIGMLQLMSRLGKEYLLEGSDYTALGPATPRNIECALLMLSIATFENLHRLIPSTCRIFSPRAILLLSDSDKMPQWVQTLPPPVAGYVPRHAKPEILLAAVHLLLAGGTCFPLPQSAAESKRQASLDTFSGNARVMLSTAHRPLNVEGEMLGITPRQYEVLVLLARGHSIKTVSQHLNISVATAKAHTEMLYQRLDVHNRNAAVYTAVARGATLGWPSIETALEHAQQPEPGAVQTSPTPSDKAYVPLSEEKKASRNKKA